MHLFCATVFFEHLHDHAESRRSNNAVFNQEDPLAAHHLRQDSVFALHPGLAVLALDKGAPDVAIPDQALLGRNAEAVGHRVTGRLGGIRNRHRDAVFGVSLQRLSIGQRLAKPVPGEVDRPPIELGGDIGKINPLKETMRLAGRGRKLLDLVALRPHMDQVPRLEIMQILKALVGKSQALGGSTEEVAAETVYQGADPERVTRQDQVPIGIEKGKAVGAIDRVGKVPEHLDKIRLLISLVGIGQVMHEELGVGIVGQVVVTLVLLKQLLAHLDVVGNVAVEAEGEPFPLPSMVALKRLGVFAPLFSAGGVTGMPDRCTTAVLVNNRTELAGVRMRQVKHIGNAAHLLVGVNQLGCRLVETGKPGGQLAAVLQIDEHVRNQPGYRTLVQFLLRIDCAVQPVDSRNTTFVMNLI